MSKGYERFEEDRPSWCDEDAGEAFYDNQPKYWDECPDGFWDAFEEAYAGRFCDDEDFAYDVAENLGFEQPDEWPYSCIDWTRAARDLRFDYWESGGYYFRDL